MITCNKCNSKNEDGSRFCYHCGNPLLEQSNQPMQSSNTREQNYTMEAPQKKSSNLTKLIVALSIVLLLMVAGGVGTFIYMMNGNKKSDDSQQTDHVVEQTDEVKVGEEKDNATEKEEAKEKSTEKKDDDTADSNDEMTDVEAKNADINAVDTVYFDVCGMIEQRGYDYYLKMDRTYSIYAYDNNRNKVLFQHVDALKIVDEKELYDMYEMLGAGVTIKGKIDADVTNKPEIKLDKITIVKEAASVDALTSDSTYDIVVEDCSWNEAYEKCRSMGGHLIQINSIEEYNKIVKLIDDEDDQNIHFYLGGRRYLDNEDYYWVDADNQMVGEKLNSRDSWSYDYWLSGEPSFHDGDTEEAYMNMFYYKGSWVLNDVPEDISDYYSGKTGYICEYEK